MKKFKLAVTGGTFDHLHAGHKALLQAAMSQAKKITIGLTTDSFVTQKTLPQLIEPFAVRKQNLKKFLKSFKAVIVPLNDAVGPATTNKSYQAIFASPETEKNVVKINRLRVKNGLKPLSVTIVKPIKDSEGKLLSSSRIREGLVDRDGLAYMPFFQKKLTLPSSQRRHFRKPLDQLLSGQPEQLHLAASKVKKLVLKNKPLLVIAVGDISVLSLTQQGITPNLSVIDLHSGRQTFATSLKKLGLKSTPNLTATNAAASITPSLAKTIQSALTRLIKRPTDTLSLLIEGEEDLAVLPAILLSPLSWVVIYGQPEEGLVYIPITQEIKLKSLKLLQKFI
jgi:pantetheine-phosphate adenylyltransferase